MEAVRPAPRAARARHARRPAPRRAADPAGVGAAGRPPTADVTGGIRVAVQVGAATVRVRGGRTAVDPAAGGAAPAGAVPGLAEVVVDLGRCPRPPSWCSSIPRARRTRRSRPGRGGRAAGRRPCGRCRRRVPRRPGRTPSPSSTRGTPGWRSPCWARRARRTSRAVARCWTPSSARGPAGAGTAVAAAGGPCRGRCLADVLAGPVAALRAAARPGGRRRAGAARRRRGPDPAARRARGRGRDARRRWSPRGPEAAAVLGALPPAGRRPDAQRRSAAQPGCRLLRPADASCGAGRLAAGAGGGRSRRALLAVGQRAAARARAPDRGGRGRRLVQYGYRVALPEGWAHTGGLPERRRTLLTPVTAPEGSDLIAIEASPLGYDPAAEPAAGRRGAAGRVRRGPAGGAAERLRPGVRGSPVAR